MAKKSKTPVNEAPYGDIGFIEASAHALFLHDIKNMLSAIVPKDIAKSTQYFTNRGFSKLIMYKK